MNNHPSKIQKERTKTWLINSLLALMYNHSYDDITISDICANADLTRQTFYRHFKTKDDLLLEYYNILFKDLYGQINRYDTLTLKEFTNIYLKFWYDHKTFTLALEKNEQLTNNLSCNLSFVSKSISKIKLPNKINKHYFTIIYAGILFSIVEEWIKEELTTDYNELTNQILSILNI